LEFFFIPFTAVTFRNLPIWDYGKIERNSLLL